MNLIDMHCDTISRFMSLPDEQNLSENELMIYVPGMERAGTMVQFFACFVHAASYEQKGPCGQSAGQYVDSDTADISTFAWDTAYKEVHKMIERINREQNNKIKIAHSYEEIMKNKNNGVISALKTVEEGGILNGDMHRLETLYHSGIRLVTLTWNFPNCIGYPNSRKSEVMERGLKEFGYQVVERMNELGMMVDVSHLSDGGFWDCIKISKAPICASHSNARSLCRHPRNLTDEMLKALGENGGVAGINFYPVFLKEKGVVTLDDIARHAVHMIHKGGEDMVAIGTDFDGFDNQPHDDWIGDVKDMERVWNAMHKRGITQRQLDKIMSGNVLRYIKSTECAASEPVK